jgi:hypothetical protein
MKKTGLLLLLLASMAGAQTTESAASVPLQAPEGTSPTNATFPFERVQTPTAADLYCAGFITKQSVPDASFVLGGLNSPSSTKFQNGDLVYLKGSGYQIGQQYTIVRELKDPNAGETFPGQHKLVAATGQPYAEVGRVRIVDTRTKTAAIAQVEFSCDPVNPGDVAIPFAEKTAIQFHAPVRFDRFLPASNKTSGRIVMAKDFDSELGTGGKVYMNVGSNQGVKVGDYFRAVRTYTQDMNDPVDSLSFKAQVMEDTQKRPPSVEPKMFAPTKGPRIHVAEFPRRAVGEIVVLTVTPTTSTGMIVYAPEDVHTGDNVEVDEQ